MYGIIDIITLKEEVMKFNLKNGNFIAVLFIVAVYIVSIIGIPLLLRQLLVEITPQLAVSISLGGGAIAALVILIFIQKTRVNNIAKENKMKLGQSILVGLAGFLFMMILQMLISLLMFLLSKIYGFDYVSQNTQVINAVIKQYPIFILYVGILAPLLEEIVFRKAIFSYLYDIMDGSNKIIRFVIPGIITGLLFAIPHDGFSPLILVYVAMSLVFSGLYLYTKRIITPIIAHLLLNFTVVLVQVFVA